MTERYDAGLLNDYGGGNVEWWQDYIRAEIERANDFHADIHATLAAENERLRKLYESAVKGRADFREAYQTARAEASAAVKVPRDLSYGEKLIAEAIEGHFGERGSSFDEYDGDTTVEDVWSAFDALTTEPATQRCPTCDVEVTQGPGNGYLAKCGRRVLEPREGGCPAPAAPATLRTPVMQPCHCGLMEGACDCKSLPSHEPAAPQEAEAECQTCVGTGTIENPAGTDHPETWMKHCPDCAPQGEPELRERIARALNAELGSENDEHPRYHPAQNSWEKPSEVWWTQWLDAADAVIVELSRHPAPQEAEAVAWLKIVEMTDIDGEAFAALETSYNGATGAFPVYTSPPTQAVTEAQLGDYTLSKHGRKISLHFLKYHEADRAYDILEARAAAQEASHSLKGEKP